MTLFDLLEEVPQEQPRPKWSDYSSPNEYYSALRKWYENK